MRTSPATSVRLMIRTKPSRAPDADGNNGTMCALPVPVAGTVDRLER